MAVEAVVVVPKLLGWGGCGWIILLLLTQGGRNRTVQVY